MPTITVRAAIVSSFDGEYVPGADAEFFAVPPTDTLAIALGATSNGTTKYAEAVAIFAFDGVATYRLKCRDFGLIAAGLPVGAAINSITFAYRARKTSVDVWMCPGRGTVDEGAATHSLGLYNANGAASINEYDASGAAAFTTSLTLGTSYAQKTAALTAANCVNFASLCTAANLRDSGFTIEFGFVNQDQSFDSTINAYDFYITVDYSVPPGAFALTAPANAAENVPLTGGVLLQWGAASNAQSYTVVVSFNSDMSHPVFFDDTVTSPSVVVNGLDHGSRYYWRVTAVNGVVFTQCNADFSFITEANAERHNTITNGLIALWDLEGPESDGHWKGEGVTLLPVTDITNGAVWPGSDLRPNGTVAVGAGRRGNAANINNAGTLCCVDQTALLLTKGDWSLEAWVNPSSLGANSHIAAKRSNSGSTASTFEMSLRQNVDQGGFTLSVLNAAGNAVTQIEFDQADSPTVGQWSQVIVLFTRSQGGVSLARLYLNGVYQATAAFAIPAMPTVNAENTTLDSIDGTKKHFVIGGPQPTGSTERYAGRIDTVRLWNRILTVAEIEWLYADGAGLPTDQFWGEQKSNLSLLFNLCIVLGVGVLIGSAWYV